MDASLRAGFLFTASILFSTLPYSCLPFSHLALFKSPGQGFCFLRSLKEFSEVQVYHLPLKSTQVKSKYYDTSDPKHKVVYL
ncbi:hypothetical protein K1719_003084 [Acacia pycnantha]|nr:hypothetical protein K1719_003084 [Acacia pycnantha]